METFDEHENSVTEAKEPIDEPATESETETMTETSEQTSDVPVPSASSEITAPDPACRLCKKVPVAGYVLFVLSAFSFAAFLFFTIPFLDLFFNHTAKDLGEALGQAFGLIFTILMMGLIGIPHVILSLISTIIFGKSIGKTLPPEKTKAIVFFAISLAMLLAAVLIAAISFIVIKRA